MLEGSPRPVVEIEHDLLLDRQAAQRNEEELVLFTASNLARGRGAKILDGHLVHIKVLAMALLEITIELVPGNGEQICAKTRLPAKLATAAYTCKECVLDEVVDIGPDPVREKIMDAVEVPLEKLIGCSIVTAFPAIEKLEIRVHDRELNTGLVLYRASTAPLGLFRHELRAQFLEQGLVIAG